MGVPIKNIPHSVMRTSEVAVASGDESRRLRIFVVPYEALLFLLQQDGSVAYAMRGMPEDARIVGTSTHLYFERHQLVLMVWSSTFPIVTSGANIPEADVEIRSIAWREEVQKHQKELAQIATFGL